MNTTFKRMFEKDTINGVTPLHLAAAEGSLLAIKTLLAQGAPTDCLNHHAQSPLYCALLLPMKHDKRLKHRKETIFNLLYACNPSMLEHQDNSGDTVAHLMAANGFDTLLAHVLSKNTTLAFIKNHRFRFPIHTAILNNQLNVTRILLKINSVAAQADSEGQIPLHYAARYGTSEMVKLCCEATADINAQDRTRKTPWMLAFEAKNANALTVLNELGAEQCNFTRLSH